MRIRTSAVVLATVTVLATGCSSGGTAVGLGIGSIVVPVPASAAPAPSPSSDRPPLSQTPVGGVYVGVARLAGTNVGGVSRRAQRIHWVLRPHCGSAACAVRLVSRSGGFSLVLRRRGPTYRGSTLRPGFLSCAARPEDVTLRVVLRATASARTAGGWIATRVWATLRNVSVPSPRCRRSYLITTAVARRR